MCVCVCVCVYVFIYMYMYLQVYIHIYEDLPSSRIARTRSATYGIRSEETGT